MHRRTWKKHEQAVAERFGTRRNIGSGSMGRSDRTRADTLHAKLFIEVKSTGKDKSLFKLWHQTVEFAAEESKIPMLFMVQTQQAIGKGGDRLVVCRLDDLTAIAAELVSNKKRVKPRRV